MGNLIEIKIHKGCILFLTQEEYKRGLRRGKAIRRNRQFDERQKARRQSDDD